VTQSAAALTPDNTSVAPTQASNQGTIVNFFRQTGEISNISLYLLFCYFSRQAETNFSFLLKLSETLFELSQVAIEKYNQAILNLGETCTNEEGTNSNADAGCTSPQSFNSGEAATSIQTRK
jgi:hypothetical protein